jgi:hypothetical protein
MLKLRALLLTIAYAAGSISCLAQITANELIEGLKAKTNSIKSFEVTARIKVDVDFIDISERQIKITYKAPDKFSFDGEGLVLLPKNGVQMEYMSLLNSNHTAIESGNELIGGTNTRIIKIIPESIDSDIILAQLWIDPGNTRLLRMKTFTKSSGSYLIDFTYAGSEDIMPSILVVNFDISNMSMPVKMMNDFMKIKVEADSEKTESLKEAKVIIEYSGYKIDYY